MTDGRDKLGQDLAVLEAMAREMDAYLQSDVLFWPLSQSGMPRLTLGGYLLREHRLRALRDELTPEQRARLDVAIETYDKALEERTVRFEARAHEELGARLRQWQQQLNDLRREKSDAYVATAVEVRAMIQALLDRLGQSPYRLDPAMAERVANMDNALRAKWQRGDFVWPEAWAAAYPREGYWWLWGQPG